MSATAGPSNASRAGGYLTRLRAAVPEALLDF
jgi:hypothetical protein